MWELMSTSTNHSWMLWTEPTAATHRRKCYSGRALTLRIRDVGSTFFVSFNRVVQCTIDYTGHVLHAQCCVAFSPCSVDQLTLTRWLKPSVLRNQPLRFQPYRHAHLIAWTPRYAYGATARARRGIFTRSGSGAGACANELDDEFEERCGGQKMKSRLMDGGRHTDPSLKDAGARAQEGVGSIQ